MHTTKNPMSRKAWFFVIGIAAFWQVVALALFAGGIFVDIYELLGIPWNSTSLINIVGSCLGLVLLELPVLILAGILFYGRRKS